MNMLLTDRRLNDEQSLGDPCRLPRPRPLQRDRDLAIGTAPAKEKTFFGCGRTTAVNLFLLVALLATIFAGMALGPVRLPFLEVLHTLLHPSYAGDASAIIFTLRLPRVLAAMLVGAALAVTGVLFQGLFRNPLADPFVLGTSGGAALGARLVSSSSLHCLLPVSEPWQCWRFAVPSSP